MSGFYAMHRGWMDHPVFSRPKEMSEREAWLWLIENAAYKARRYRVGVIVVDLERGQLAVSIRHLADQWGWSKSRVDRFLTKLSGHQMIGTAAGQGVTVITVCNYTKYQDARDSDETETGTAAGQQRDSSGTIQNKERRKEGKEESLGSDEPKARPEKIELSVVAGVPDGHSEAEVFRYGKDVLGPTAGGMIAKLKAQQDHDLLAVKDILRQAAEKENPREWLGAVLAGDRRAKTPDHILFPPHIYTPKVMREAGF